MARPAGLAFTERMHGAIACGPTDNPLQNAGGLSWAPFAFDVDAHIVDVDHFLRSDEHPIELRSGTVTSGHFGTCKVTDGEINLMVAGREDFERLMRYRVCFTTEDGQELTLLGFKDVVGSRLRLWYDTTRVFGEIYQGSLAHGAARGEAPLVGVGVLEIPALTFLIQLTTFRPVGRGGLRGLRSYGKFMLFFTESLIKPYVLGLFWRTKSDVRHARQQAETAALLAKSRELLQSE